MEWLRWVVFNLPRVDMHPTNSTHVGSYHIEGFQECFIYTEDRYAKTIDTWDESPCTLRDWKVGPRLRESHYQSAFGGPRNLDARIVPIDHEKQRQTMQRRNRCHRKNERVIPIVWPCVRPSRICILFWRILGQTDTISIWVIQKWGQEMGFVAWSRIRAHATYRMSFFLLSVRAGR